MEEVARRVGFDAIGRTVPKPDDQVGALTHAQQDRRPSPTRSSAPGSSEAITVPSVAPGTLDAFGTIDAGGRVQPAAGRGVGAAHDAAAGPPRGGGVQRRARAVGRSRCSSSARCSSRPDAGDVLPVEREHVAAVLAGVGPRRPVEPDRPVDVYDAPTSCTSSPTRSGARTSRSRRVVVPGGTRAARPGSSPVGSRSAAGGRARRRRSSPTPGSTGAVVAFELDLDALAASPRHVLGFRAPSPFPPSNIDLAFVVDDAVPAGAWPRPSARPRATCSRTCGLRRVPVRPLGAGRRSVAFALRFRAPDRTLTDAEVGELRQRAIDAAAAAHGADAPRLSRQHSGPRDAHEYADLCILSGWPIERPSLGGSGYAGAELLRLLAGHPEIDVVSVSAASNAGTSR